MPFFNETKRDPRTHTNLQKEINMISAKPSVADPGCLSRIPDPNFFHPGSRIQGQKGPDPVSGSASASKNLSILTQKIVSKFSEI
jgi:hypothetical protein